MMNYAVRVWKNRLFTLLSGVICLAVIGVLAHILYTLFRLGQEALSISLFTQDTPPPDALGGLKNAMIGSLMMTGLGLLIAAPIGIFAGTFISRAGNDSFLAKSLRFFNDALLSVPSIVVGLFIYMVIVTTMGQFSGIAGSLALSLIAIPIICRAVEDVLNLVPLPLREAGFALGAGEARVTFSILYRTVKSGILSAILLALARILGETAPLLFTALNNQYTSYSLEKPMANLPVVIFQYAMSPYAHWQSLAWAGALLITILVLFFSILSRILFHKYD